jgi:hypothetical protein
MEKTQKLYFGPQQGLLAALALLYLIVLIATPGDYALSLALPLVLGCLGFFLVDRLGKSPRDLSDIITALTVLGCIYSLFLLLLLLPGLNLPGSQEPYWRAALYLDGDTRGIVFVILLLFNHLTWSFNIKNYWWLVRAPMSFIFLLAIIILSSFRTWLLLPPALFLFLLLTPTPRRARVVISFIPSLLAAFFITPVLGMATSRGQLLDSIIWVMGGVVLSIVGSFFVSLIDKTSPYQKAFFFVVFFAFFILFTSVYFYALLAFSTPAGDTAPNLIRIVPRSILDYFDGPGGREAVPGLEGPRLWAAWLLGLPWLLFLKDRYREYKGEKDPQHITFSTGLMTSGILILLHSVYAPALLVGWPALFSWSLLGAKLHPPPDSLAASVKKAS